MNVRKACVTKLMTARRLESNRLGSLIHLPKGFPFDRAEDALTSIYLYQKTECHRRKACGGTAVAVASAKTTLSSRPKNMRSLPSCEIT